MTFCLIVDDSATIRKIARKSLEEFGLVCEEAEDGVYAYEFCQKQMPGMILLDWNMPRMNGLEFIEKLRGMENGNTPKVLFCTTESSMDHIMSAMKAGANEYIMKPFDQIILRTKLVQLDILEDVEA